MPKQDAYILNGSDQIILDLLAPESAPSGTFEAVMIGRIGKTAFHDPFSSLSISKGRSAARLFSAALNQLMAFMPLEGAGGFGASTFFS